MFFYVFICTMQVNKADLIRFKFDANDPPQTTANNQLEIPFRMEGVFDEKSIFSLNKKLMHKNDQFMNLFNSGIVYMLSGEKLTSPVTSGLIFDPNNGKPFLFYMGGVAVKIVRIVPEESSNYAIYVQQATNEDMKNYKNFKVTTSFYKNNGGKRKQTKRGRRMKRKSRFRRSRRF